MALLVAGCLSVMTAIASHHQLARPAMRALLTWTLFTAPIIPDDNLPQLFVLYLAGMVWSVSIGYAADTDTRSQRHAHFQTRQP